MAKIISYGSTDFMKAYPGISTRVAVHLFGRFDLLTSSPAEYLRDHEEYFHGLLYALFITGALKEEQYEDLMDLVIDLCYESDVELRKEAFVEFMLGLQQKSTDK